MVKISASIDVSNLKQAERFYIEGLGCKKLRDQGPDMAVLSTDNCDIYLQEKEAGTKPLVSDEVVRDYKRHWDQSTVVSYLSENSALTLPTH